MKKLLLLLLSLLFAALVFQSCNKISHNTNEEDLVPIVFSQAAVTKTPVGLGPTEEIHALVLGTRGRLNLSGETLDPNDWTKIYSSLQRINMTDGGDSKVNLANGKILFIAESTPSFDSKVAYPVDGKFVFIKALAPCSAIDGIDGVDGIFNNEVGPEGNNVTFSITGRDDIVATREIDMTKPYARAQGCGNWVDPDVNLIFDHLLSKIDIYIVAENKTASEYWGSFEKMTFIDGFTKFVYSLSHHKISSPSIPSNYEVNTSLSGDEKKMSWEPVVPVVPVVSAVPEVPEVPLGTGEKFAGSIYVYPTVISSGSEAAAGTPLDWTIRLHTLNAAGTPMSGNLKVTHKLEKGTQYKLLITFNENKKLGFNVDIVQWDELSDNTTRPPTVII